MAKHKTWKFGLIITLLTGSILLLVPLALQWISGNISNDGSLVTIKTDPYETRLIFLPHNVLLTSGNSKIRLWNSHTGKLLSEKAVSFDAIEILPNGQFCVGTGYNSSNTPVTAIWNMNSALMSSQLISNKSTNGTSKFLYNPAISPNGKMVAGIEGIAQERIGRNSNPLPIGGICVRDTVSGKIIWSVEEFGNIRYGTIKNESSKYYSFDPPKFIPAFSPDGKLLAETTAIYDPYEVEIRLRDSKTGKLIRVLTQAKKNSQHMTLNDEGWHCLAYSPDGKFLAAVGGDKGFYSGENGNAGWLYLWDVATGRLIRKFLKPNSIPITIRFSPDGSKIACGNAVFGRATNYLGGEVNLWDTKTGKLICTYSRETQADRVALTREAKMQQAENTLRRLAQRPLIIGTKLPSDKSFPVTHFAFSPDGKRIAAAHEDGVVKIWAVP